MTRIDFVEVDKFPSLERDGQNSMERGRGSTSNAQKFIDPKHHREVIFALPSLQLHLKTEHLQTATIPDLDGTLKTILSCALLMICQNLQLKNPLLNAVL